MKKIRKKKSEPKNDNTHAAWLSRYGEYVTYNGKQGIVLEKTFGYNDTVHILDIHTGETFNLNREDRVEEIKNLDFSKSSPKLIGWLLERIVQLELRLESTERNIDYIRDPHRS